MIKGATTNLWSHMKKVHGSLLSLPANTSQHTLEQYNLFNLSTNEEIFTGVI